MLVTSLCVFALSSSPRWKRQIFILSFLILYTPSLRVPHSLFRPHLCRKQNAKIFCKMTSIAKQHSTATSPNSSEDVESHHATPATKLSAFSPDDTRDFNTSGSRIVRVPAYDLKITTAKSNSCAKQATSTSLSHHDPFVSASPLESSTTKSSVESSKLSPIAAEFTPTTVFDSPLAGDQKYGSFGGTRVSKSSAVGSLLDKKGMANPILHSGSAAPSTVARPNPIVAESFSTEERRSRSLMIQTGARVSPEQINEYFNVRLHCRSFWTPLTLVPAGEIPVLGSNCQLRASYQWYYLRQIC